MKVVINLNWDNNYNKFVLKFWITAISTIKIKLHVITYNKL